MPERTIYQGNQSEFYKLENFKKFIMKKGAIHATKNYELVSKESEFYLPQGMNLDEEVSLKNSAIIDYKTNLRMVPRDSGLWSVKITLSGKEEDLDNVENMIRNSTKL